MLQHTCLQCGKSFLDKRPHAKYCCNTCYGLSKRTLPEIPCERCNSPFRPKDQTRFCSRECYDADRVEQSEKRRAKTCAHCGKDYTVPYGHAETIYCSRRCSADSQITSAFRDCPVCSKSFKVTSDVRRHCSQACYDIARKPVLKPCAVCGSGFIPRTDDSKYCSKPCEHIGRRKHGDSVCKQCGKEFRVSKDNAHFCSVRCYGVFQRGLSKRAGKNFTNAQRRQIQQRDNHQCVTCGATMPLPLHVDHIKPVALGGLNTLDNGRTLCHACHVVKTRADRAEMRRAKLLATIPR